ncbi:PLAC8 family-domain-containing protein [Flagelloscypha sp. PMI_526]|nr:PLAC8 family-domain-containing protein [Flagelloscypha sp. PMI_526]
MQAPPPVVQTQQPQATPTMTLTAGGSRNAKNLAIQSDGREWTYGLFDCCDDGSTCMMSWCCPCVVYSQTKHRLSYLQRHDKPDPEVGGDFCSGTCCGYAALNAFCGLSFALQISTRSTMRSRYNIRGDGCSDCFTAFCCRPCELTQEHREVLLEEESYPGYKA